MAQTGYTPISLYYSATASAVPVNTNLVNGELAINITDGKLYYKNNSGTVTLLAASSGASGDVVGPASATDTAVALFDGATGKLIKNSPVTIGTTGNTVISGTDNSNAMLRITQLGTGNALLVEDSTNPDSSPFVIDASGRIIEGYTTTTTVLDPSGVARTPQLQIHGTTLSVAGQSLTNWASSGTSYSGLFLSKSKSAVIGTQGVVASGDIIGGIQFSGDDGTNFIPTALISSSVDGTPGTNDMPGRLVFSTTADGASTPTERVRIDSAGQTKFSYNAVVEVTDNTNAALRITQLGTGNALLVEDSSNPDTSPFVIDASGNVLNGYETPLTIGYTSGYQQHSTTIAKSSMQLGLWAASASPAQFIYAKSRGAVGTQTILQNNDAIGTTRYYGSDGTSMIEAAKIEAAVDGTPGTSDMPGRLVFSTTADGDSSPTERMRIDSAGTVHIGGTTTLGGVSYELDIECVGNDSAKLNLYRNDTSIASGNNIGTIGFYGNDTTSNTPTRLAYINCVSSGTHGAGDNPTDIVFGTTPDGTETAVDAVRIRNNGGLEITRTAVTAPDSGDGNVFSGTYTPTLTNTTNITSSSAFTFSYMRVGNVVTVQGRVTIVPASAAACELNIALPIASNLALESLSGCVGPTSVYTVGFCDGNATLDTARITFLAPATTSRQWPVSFTYRII